jgi:hypothetical protein
MENIREIFKHKNGNLYAVLDLLKMKHPVSRKWVDAYMYMRIEKEINEDGSFIYATDEKFVREKEDFLKKFERGLK